MSTLGPRTICAYFSILRVPERPLKNVPPRYFSHGKLVQESLSTEPPADYGVARDANQPGYGDQGPTFATQLQAKYEFKTGGRGDSSFFKTYSASILGRNSGALVAVVDGHAYLGGWLDAFFGDGGYKKKCYFGSEGVDMLLRATFQDRVQAPVNAPVEPKRR